MRPARLWPIAVVAALAITVGANILLLWAASDPSGSAVERDYYRKAIVWDSTLAARERSAALGWHLEASLGRPGGGGVPIEAELADATGRPMAGAVIEVEAIHNLLPNAPRRVRLIERSPGRYQGVLPAEHYGLWELRFDARAGGERFTTVLRRDTAVP